MLKKLMLLAAMLAMVLVAAAPALAQDVTAGDQYTISDSFNTYTVAECIQLVNQEIEQDQYVSGDVEGGDAEAEAEEDSNAAASGGDASVDQAATQEAVQYCQDYLATAIAEDGGAAAAEAGAAAGAAAGAEAGGGGGGGGAAGELPATGGISLLTLGAGALLVGGGLVARKLVR